MNDEDAIYNWELFKKQATKVKTSNMSSFMEILEEDQDDNHYNMILAPASTKTEFAGAYAGGLVELSLRVLSYMAKLRTLYNLKDEISDEDLVTVGLFYDVGKLGIFIPKLQKHHLNRWNNYYVENKSSWHRENLGLMYKVNQELEFFNPQDLSLMLLTTHGIPLSVEAWHAISSFRQERVTEAMYPKEHEPPLASLLRQSVWGACCDAKKVNYLKRVK